MLRLLGSVRLFFALVIVLIVLSALATVVPQGVAPAQLVERYGAFGAGTLRSLGLDHFSSSVQLAAILVLMEVNLLVCTGPRLLAKIRRRHNGPRTRSPVRALTGYASDIVHLGLAVVLAGAMVTAVARQSESHLVSTGETVVSFPGRLTVVSSEREFNDNAILVGWTINIRTDEGRMLAIRPNRPARYGRYRVHFAHWSVEPLLALSGQDGSTGTMRVGEGVLAPDGRAFVFAEVGENGAPTIAVITADRRVERTFALTVGDTLGPFRYDGRDEYVVNGFSVVRDPGRVPIAVGLILFSLGIVGYVLQFRRKYG